MVSYHRVFLTVLALTFALTGLARADLIWVAATGGNVPSGALAGGHEASGETLYICRAIFDNFMNSGKVRTGFQGCNIGYGGKEEVVPAYEVLVERSPRWVAAQDGNIPADAVAVGQAGGKEIFVCRGRFQGGIHVGKIVPPSRACFISYGGRQDSINPYEVLVSR